MAEDDIRLEDSLPEYGWRIKLDHTFPQKPRPSKLPRWRQLPKLVGLGYRFMKYATKEKKEGRVPFIDPYKMNPCRQVYGVPLGGIGCGSIGRGWKGDFNRWQLTPGMYSYDTVHADQFVVCIRRKGKTVYQQVLSPQCTSNGLLYGHNLKSWNWGFNGANAIYHALYPRAWTVYEIPSQRIRLICRQISPIFPNDYKDTSLPVAVFIWTVQNYGKEDADVSIMFTFQSGEGKPDDASYGHYNEPFTCKGIHSEVGNEQKAGQGSRSHVITCDVTGVLLHRNADPACTYVIAAKAKHQENNPLVRVTWKTIFDAKSPGRRLWQDLHEDGLLSSNPDPSHRSNPGEAPAAAVAASVTVPAGERRTLEFSLAWDMPIVYFGSKRLKHYRWYTKFFGYHGNAGSTLVSHALRTYTEWESKIDEWQEPILRDKNLPAWYKSAIFNELYFIADGGTIWLDVAKEESRNIEVKYLPEVVKNYGRFAYLEGHEYRMYNTYDVHFYASFALIMLWPMLQLSLQHDIADYVNKSDLKQRLTMMSGRSCPRKVQGCVPHDIGDPDDEPWTNINAYTIHDTSEWKDLNLKFVLQLYRDYVFTGDLQFLDDLWPVAKTVMAKAVSQDSDGDGLIDNSGFADQTYDAWIVSGASAYCGGLWLASLRTMSEIAKVLGYPEDIKKYNNILQRGKKAYERKLWNGRYYNYEFSKRRYHNSIMADQMAGQWYLKACEIGQHPNDRVFPKAHVISALTTVFEYNVLRFHNGRLGAVNGMRPDGKVDTSSVQAEEVWTGITYAVAASMIQEGLVEEGFRTACGVYRSCYERFGMSFQTPEAYTGNGRFRSLGYMRPLSIWAMQWAWEKRSQKKYGTQSLSPASSPCANEFYLLNGYSEHEEHNNVFIWEDLSLNVSPVDTPERKLSAGDLTSPLDEDFYVDAYSDFEDYPSIGVRAKSDGDLNRSLTLSSGSSRMFRPGTSTSGEFAENGETSDCFHESMPG
ncbi:non-lysosomal glucosylceramidase-like [Dendronephthya gigantea]|uniref:non-lysosomal glucosylceramidase-like n=1 Tax=Dendronephthya gigantea TaxID=151771 RepID=UPI00106ACDFA|nr:non-lysosomal glucosylceramidase-like [Dendronephthya gigantea]